jgi:flagellar basal-body rod protein FlgG
MLEGMLQATQGCLKEEMRMDVCANNLANANVIGFKTNKISFQDLLAAAEDGTEETSSGTESEEGTLVQLRADLSQGDSRFTGQALDFAIHGKGFFKVETEEGLRYTRKGNFTLDSDGFIITQDENRVLGQGGPIVLTSDDIEVTDDGMITLDGTPVGQLAVVDFDNYDDLNKDGHGLFRNDSEYPEIPVDPETRIQQGFVELSNVNIVEEMVQMIQSLRGFESYQKAIQVLDGIDNEVINDVPS